MPGSHRSYEGSATASVNRGWMSTPATRLGSICRLQMQ